MAFNFVEENFHIGQTSPDLSPQFVFYKRGFRLGGAYSPRWQEVTIKGTNSVVLANSLANSLLSLKLFGGTEQRLLPDTYRLYTSVTANGVTYEYSSQNLTQIPCKRIAGNVFGLYNYTTKVFISEV